MTGKQKSGKTNLANVDAGVSEEEKLVRAGNDDGPKEAEDPSTERRGGYRGIVRVGYRGSDFGVRRFVFESDGRRVKVGVVDEGLRYVSERTYDPTLERTDICDSVIVLFLGVTAFLDVERRPLRVFV
jgi:hypothetical protein